MSTKKIDFSLILICITGMLFLMQPTSAYQDETPIRLRADLISVEVIVTDKDGNPIPNLKGEDFLVYENDRPRAIDFFEPDEVRAMTKPLAVVIALDISGSISREEIAQQRLATEYFMRLVQQDSMVAVMTFNHQIKVIQGFTNDLKKVSSAFNQIRKPGGSSKIFGSIDYAVSMLEQMPRFSNGRKLHRVVIIVTDGYDNIDSTEQSRMIRRANNAEVTVYSITLPIYFRGKLQERALTLLDVSKIVPLTGGMDYSADKSDYHSILRTIAEEIQSHYTLAYYPDRQFGDNTLRRVRVEVKKEGVVVRTNRSSYSLESKMN